jgi:type VII secretion protein EccB
VASKKDLVEGQAFSRRRLITAFVSGAPGGREVEPGKPLRAVVGGVVLSAILVVGALAAGLLAPTLPDGWDQDSLVIAEDTGARYVALDGVLYPVINTASARLLIPSNFKVVSAKAEKFTDSRRGPTLGIIGAPDALPTPGTLVDTGWTSCASQGEGVATTVSHTPPAQLVADQAVIVTLADGAEPGTYLVDNGLRYRVPDDLVISLRRALSLDTAPIYRVTAAWLNLFTSGPDVGSFEVPGAGAAVTGGPDELPDTARVGSVVADSGNPDRPYLLLQGGRIAALTPFAYAMYRMAADTGADTTVKLPGAVFASLGPADAVWPAAWPAAAPTPLRGVPCALLLSGSGASGTKPTVKLAASQTAPDDGRVTATVDPGAGALVRAIGVASVDNGPVFLVDQTGSAFPVTGGGDSNPIAQLGFSSSDITPVPQAWLGLLDTGPTLSAVAARTVITSANAR